MWDIAKQWLFALAGGIASITLENFTGSTLVCEFLQGSGLMSLMTLLAVNTAMFGVLITTMTNLEHTFERYFAFDDSKKESLKGIQEMVWLLILFYALSALTPKEYWELQGLEFTKINSVMAFFVGALARMCLFQTLYTMYDFLRALVKLTTDPRQRV